MGFLLSTPHQQAPLRAAHIPWKVPRKTPGLSPWFMCTSQRTWRTPGDPSLGSQQQLQQLLLWESRADSFCSPCPELAPWAQWPWAWMIPCPLHGEPLLRGCMTQFLMKDSLKLPPAGTTIQHKQQQILHCPLLWPSCGLTSEPVPQSPLLNIQLEPEVPARN